MVDAKFTHLGWVGHIIWCRLTAIDHKATARWGEHAGQHLEQRTLAVTRNTGNPEYFSTAHLKIDSIQPHSTARGL